MARRKPQIYWRESGRGPALVLINGWSASGLAWPSAWLRELRGEFRVICPDNRGTGWSRHAETPYSIGDLASDIVDVLDDAQAVRATVLGVSMGGMIAAELAIRAPERLHGLVLTATRGPGPTQRPLMAPSIAWQLIRPLGRGQTLDAYFRRLWSSAAAPGFAKDHPDVLEELVAQCVERPTPRALTMLQLRAASAWGRSRRLARISTPAVVVHGEADPLVHVRHARRLTELIPAAGYVELPGVGHLTPHEAPQALLDALRTVAAQAAEQDVAEDVGDGLGPEPARRP
jgi:3-oxoadipate enol-lactonase